VLQFNKSAHKEYSKLDRLGKRTRQENGLVELTKLFIDMMRQSETNTVDLNYAVECLNVQKRRIYDITNVLEGVGLIIKQKKNKLRWAGPAQEMSKKSKKGAPALDQLDLQMQRLEEEDVELEENLRNL